MEYSNSTWKTWSFAAILSIFLISLPAKASTGRPQVGNVAYALIPALVVGNLLLLNTDPPRSAHWQGGILFDDAGRELFRLKNKGQRSSLKDTGDLLLTGIIAYPFFADALADTWLSRKDSETAIQLSLMAAQAMMFTALLRSLANVTVGRERPLQRECVANPDYDEHCNLESSRSSFFSGHAAFSFTAAGLICAAHEKLDLTGGSAPCYAALGLATIVSLSRVMSDKHYVTDTVVGVAVGMASGYFLPKLFQYQRTSISTIGAAVTPTFSRNGFGLNLGFIL